MIKVLFIEPPVNYPNVWVNLGSNLGISLLISSLGQMKEIESHLYSFEYAKLMGVNLSINEVLDHYNPDVLCVSVLTHGYPFAQQISIRAKERGCVIVWGGIFVSQNAPNLLNRHNFVDYYIPGEGEFILPSLIEDLLLDIGCSMSRDTNPHIYTAVNRNNCEDMFRLPAFSHIPNTLIHEHKLRATLETSRGCQFDCKYCSIKGTEYRVYNKEIPHIAAELINIRQWGFGKALVCDSNFVLSKSKFSAFSNIKNEICPELKLRITVRADLLNKEMIDGLKPLNVDEIIIGVEHVHGEILMAMKKTTDTDNWERLVRSRVLELADIGFLVHPIFMFGWPGETRETLRKNQDTACALGKHPNVEPFVAFITPHPGNETEEFVVDGRLRVITSDYSRFIHLYPVAVPISLGDDALKYFVDAHNTIREVSHMTYRNPCFDIDFIKSYADLL